MKGQRSTLGVVFAALVLTGCVVPLDIDITDGHNHPIYGNGHVVAESRAVYGYHTIVASGASRVVVTKNGYEGVEVHAEENLLRYLDSYVRSGVLYLTMGDGVSLSPREDVVFYVSTSELGEIRLSGAVDAQVDLGWEPSLYVTLSGATSLEVWGQTDYLNAQASGASRLRSLDLEARRVDLTTSGAAGAFVWATERLDAVASGVSFIRFAGDPIVYATTSETATIGRY